MELTAGRIPCLWDSSLGFRHGPKSFVQGATDILLYLSPDPHAALYDRDLAAELRSQFPDSRVTTLGPGGDLDVAMPEGAAWGARARHPLRPDPRRDALRPPRPSRWTTPSRARAPSAAWSRACACIR